jgi:hypothetical protein
VLAVFYAAADGVSVSGSGSGKKEEEIATRFVQV